MSTQLPQHREAVADKDGLLTLPWRRWVEAINRAANSNGTDNLSLAADITAIATALGSPDGTVAAIPDQDTLEAVIAGPDGTITVTGTLASGRVDVRLTELADSGVGAGLYSITRDGYGRIEGMQAATAADLAYDNGASGLTATDVQAAIDEVAANSGGGNVTTEDTWTNRPGSPGDGDLHFNTDAPSLARWNGSAWKHRIGATPVVPPVLASFTQVNFGTSTTAALGPFTSVIAQAAAAYALRVLDMAAPATPYTIEVGFLLPAMAMITAQAPLYGAGFRQASDGKMHLAWVDGSSNLFRTIKMNSATSANSVYTSTSINFNPTGLVFLRFSDDGTNRKIDVGQGWPGNWLNVQSVGRTDFLTADRVCVAVNLESTVLMDRIHWVHWKQS